MTIEFMLPVGATTDVAELEFISALHQTELHCRQDASIKAIDIVHFLTSRYGIRVTVREVEETILRGLGGGDDGEVECIDLVEMVSILMIPELVKSSRVLFEGPLSERGREEFQTDWEYNEYQRRFKILKERVPDWRMIETVLEMILKDSTGSALPKRLDRQLVKDIFAAYGETELVEHDAVIDEMIAAASSEDEETGAFLDTRSFARALTSDVQKYDVYNETKLSTHYHDVFDTYKTTKEKSHWISNIGDVLSMTKSRRRDPASEKCENREPEEKLTADSQNEVSEDVRPVERSFTAPSIDYVAGTYSSKVYVVTLWVCAVATYFAYLWDFDIAYGRQDCTLTLDDEGNPTNRGEHFGCRIVNGLVNWLVIMVELSVLGSVFICFASIGNSVFSTSPIALLVGMGFVSLFTIVPFLTEWRTPFFETVNSSEPQYQFMYYISFFLGIALLVMQAKLFIKVVAPDGSLKKLNWLFVPNIVVSESNIKQAASFKMNRMLKNALDIHSMPSKYMNGSSGVSDMAETSYGRALLNFNDVGEKFETTTVGGVGWAWSHWLSGNLQREEGIFLNSHVVSGNVAQIIVCIFVLISGIVLVVNETRREPSDDPSAGAYEPERWMVILSIFVGLTCCMIAAVAIMLKYIPSTITTVLQYRTGVLPTLKDKDFWVFRVAEDQITLLFGSIFWGAFFTAFAIAFFFGLIVFAAVWQVTRDLFLTVFANLVGLTITLLIKVLVLRCLRQSFYAAFYRKRPTEANMLGVMLQSWNIALATGYMLARGLMLLLATMLFIGRIDRPFLAPETAMVGVLHLDSYPLAYRKALLLNEAHRHPYIERLGFIYMYKLRYGDNFARTTGSIWRLLFTFALFPWLRKYRVQARPQLKDDSDVDERKFKFGSYRVLPKPPPRYGSIVGMPSSTTEMQVNETQATGTQEEAEEPVPPEISDPSGNEETGERHNPLVDREVMALKEEIEHLRKQNELLTEKLDSMEEMSLSCDTAGE